MLSVSKYLLTFMSKAFSLFYLKCFSLFVKAIIPALLGLKI